LTHGVYTAFHEKPLKDAPVGTDPSLVLKCLQKPRSQVKLRAFKVDVRPLLEYATCVWSLYFNYAIDKIEFVQRKFTKRLKVCKYGLFNKAEFSVFTQLGEEISDGRSYLNLQNYI